MTQAGTGQRMYDVEIGHQLRTLRLAYLLKQHDVATQVGVTKGTIARWEQGTRSMNIATLLAIADLFGVAGWQLLPPAHQQSVAAAHPTVATPQDQALARITTLLGEHPELLPHVLETILQHLVPPSNQSGASQIPDR